MNKQRNAFFRAIIITLIITSLTIFGFLACCKVYENTNYVAFGVYKKAVEITEDTIRIFDFVIKIKMI